MAPEHSIQRYRRWYTALLGLYPRRFHERFGEPMAQTFHDLLRERAEAGNGVFGCALSMYIDTFGGIVSENKSAVAARHNNVIRVVVATACILLLPLIAMQFTDEVAWSPADFAVAGILLLGAGLTYLWVAGKGSDVMYRIAVGVAVAAGLLLVWMNLAVGLIGSEDNPANLMYVGVLSVGIIGALIARFQSAGMVRTMVAMAVAQAAVAVFALTPTPLGPVGAIVALNGFFVVLFLISAGLFRHAARTESSPDQGQPLTP